MKHNKSVSSEKLAYGLVSVISIVYILYVLKPFLIPFLISILLSIMVFPIVQFLEKKLKFNRVFSSISVLLILGSIIGVLIWIISFEVSIFVNKSDLYSIKLTELYNNGIQYIENTYGITEKQIANQNNLKIESLIKDNVSKIGSFLSSSTSLISDLILVPIYMFFFLLYRTFFQQFIYKVFSNQNNEFLKNVLTKIFNVQKNYLTGLFTVMIIVGILNSIGLLFLGIENAVFFGFFASLLLLIPYIGIIIGSLLPALVALVTKDSVWYSVGVIALFGFVQFLEGNFITPKITGSKVSVNAFVSILSLLLFSMLWGTAGMVLALPITATLKVIFDHIPSLKAYGYLIGEPDEKHFNRKI